jgi:hypothetical protein
MIKKIITIQILLALMVILISCSSKIPTSAPTPEIDPVTGYPVTGSSEPGTGYPVENVQTNVTTEPGSSVKIYGANELPVAPQPPDPVEGNGSISGVIFSANSRYAIPQTAIYLTLGWGDNKDEIPAVFMGPGKNDILSKTNENGQFSINNIPPGTYYLLMSAPPYDWALGYKDAALTALKIVIEPGTKMAAGVVYVFWP